MFSHLQGGNEVGNELVTEQMSNHKWALDQLHCKVGNNVGYKHKILQKRQKICIYPIFCVTLQAIL